MKWFRRHNTAPAESVEDIATARAARFWVRWSEQLPSISAALGDREPARVENDLCELVADLHPDLHFALDRGQRAVYALVISGQEDPELRPFTDAWKAAAPDDGPIWEYHDSVPPVPDPRDVTVNLGGHAIRLADILVVAQVDTAEHVVDVAVYHPELGELDHPSQQALTFLPLDATLGERVAGQRLRRVETAVDKPENAITLIDLRELVGTLDEPQPGPEPESE